MPRRLRSELPDGIYEDWLHAWREDESWNAAGGPLNLREMLAIFLAWADA